jgi:DNA-binding LytR/AlgR family response regulator
MSSPELRVLAVDDEAPSLADLVFELRSLARIGDVVEANDATGALRALRDSDFDAVFLDVRMPGLDGLELARVLKQFRVPPPVVFVTAFDAHAVDAFEVNAVDYVLKPVRRERLERALDRIEAHRERAARAEPVPAVPAPAPIVAAPAAAAERHPLDEEMISIESGGRIRLIARRDVQYVSSSGDYVRLHLAGSSVLVRAAMATLEERWAGAGFVRIHRSYLVALAHVDEVRVEPGRGYVVRIGERGLPVSRRLATQLRARLVEDASRRRRP